jgi:hypothetical protein
MANVFISHRGADTDEAERLARELTPDGHRVWLDAWAIKLGDSIVGRMHEGLTGATHVVLCLSASDVLAPWISAEWMSALARQLNGEGVKILPVRLTGGDLPAILADRRYADLVADWDRGVNELRDALR